MGKGPDDIASEIVDLRKESDVIVEELLRRASFDNVARGATATVTERASTVVAGVADKVSDAADSVSRLADDMPEPVKRHPMAVTYSTVGVVAGILGFAISWIAVTRRPSAADRTAQRLRETRDRASDSLRDWQDRLLGLREGVRSVRVMTVREEPSMVKRVLWAGLVSLMATLGSLLFKRMTAGVWRTTMKEDPPEK